jgi:hypothetical protein
MYAYTGFTKMKTVMISYDLNRMGKNYDDVISYITSLGPWARPLRSQWLVKTDLSTLDIIHGLRQHGADSDDYLLVMDVTKREAAWANLTKDVATWIKTNL